MNNLYGHAMSQYLSYANFKWVKNIDKINWICTLNRFRVSAKIA